MVHLCELLLVLGLVLQWLALIHVLAWTERQLSTLLAFRVLGKSNLILCLVNVHVLLSSLFVFLIIFGFLLQLVDRLCQQSKALSRGVHGLFVLALLLSSLALAIGGNIEMALRSFAERIVHLHVSLFSAELNYFEFF